MENGAEMAKKPIFATIFNKNQIVYGFMPMALKWNENDQLQIDLNL